jgi:hypothetical protein
MDGSIKLLNIFRFSFYQIQILSSIKNGRSPHVAAANDHIEVVNYSFEDMDVDGNSNYVTQEVVKATPALIFLLNNRHDISSQYAEESPSDKLNYLRS